LDRQHREMSSHVLRAADRLDRFLHDLVVGKEQEPAPVMTRYYGDRRTREETGGSYIEITPLVSMVDGEGIKADLDFGAKLRLPRFSERLQLFVDRFQEEDSDVFDSLGARQRPRGTGEGTKEGSVGVRFFLVDGMTFRSSFSVGMSFKPEPTPRLKLQGRIAKALNEQWASRLTQSVFWESDDGFGEKTQLEFIRKIDDHRDVRSSTAVIWSETSEGVEAGQAFTYIHILARKRVIAPRVGVGGHVEPTAAVDRYFFRVPYRQRIHRDWMFLEIEPGIDFPDERDFKATPLLIVRLDMLFGSIPP
jgi:hypothetical protein